MKNEKNLKYNSSGHYIRKKNYRTKIRSPQEVNVIWSLGHRSKYYKTVTYYDIIIMLYDTL